MAPLIHRVVRRLGTEAARDESAGLAEEVPVALVYNGISHAVMLATPQDLEDFALGFSLSEGILDAAEDLYAVEEEQSELGITLRLRVASSAFVRLKERRRSMSGRTGCGLCNHFCVMKWYVALIWLPSSISSSAAVK